MHDYGGGDVSIIGDPILIGTYNDVSLSVSNQATVSGTKLILETGSGGIDTSDATLTSGAQMLSGVTAYSQGSKHTGTIVTRTASDLTVSGGTVTVPAGHYASQATKAVASGSATINSTISVTPSISVSSSGLITASVNGSVGASPVVTEGYVSAATTGIINYNGSNTSQLTTQAAQTITPTTQDQTIASGRYLTGTQTIEGIVCTNLSAANIVSGVTVKIGTASDDDSVASVTGTASGGASNFVSGTFTTSSTTGAAYSVTIPYTGSGYPIAAIIVINGGAYNSSISGWYNAVQRYAVGQWTYSKSTMTSTPSYSTSGSANYGVTTWIYKNSTSSSTNYSRSSAMNTNVLSSSSATGAGATCCRFTSKTNLSYYVASSSYGLLAGTTYAYYIVYSS